LNVEDLLDAARAARAAARIHLYIYNKKKGDYKENAIKIKKNQGFYRYL